MGKNKFYITNAIPYVNAKPHIGHVYEFFQSDTLARFHRQLGEDVRFLLGSDDNSLKNVQSAEKEGREVAEYVTEAAANFINLIKSFEISNDDFIRTTEKRHFAGAEKLWKACEADIYKKKYTGLYCVGCEEFKKEEELADGCCPEHPNAKLDVVEEENYFFKLSKYQDQLIEIIEKDIYKITPETRKNEALSFIKQGLEDFSVSRSKERAKGWGIPVPGDDSQVMYVWFDALSNYITALDYAGDGELFKKYWPADVHVVGKGIQKFHAIFWPAMLLSAKIELPKNLFVHGYITAGGAKISKSTGNAIDPVEIAQKYGLEPLRYYLLRYIPSYGDGDFSTDLFLERYSSGLSNDLGNLLQRTLTMAGKYQIKPFDLKSEIYPKVTEELNRFRFDSALAAIWEEIANCNTKIDREKPWVLAKDDPQKLLQVMEELITEIGKIAVSLEPFMPRTSQRMKEQLISFEPEPLFPRLDDQKVRGEE